MKLSEESNKNEHRRQYKGEGGYHNIILSHPWAIFIPESYGYWTEKSNAKYGRNSAILAKILYVEKWENKCK